MKRIRRPDIRLEFVTDENIFTLRYSNAVEVTGEQVGNKVLGFQTKMLCQMIVLLLSLL